MEEDELAATQNKKGYRETLQDMVKKVERQMPSPSFLDHLAVRVLRCKCSWSGPNCRDIWGLRSKIPYLFSCDFTANLRRVFSIPKGQGPFFKSVDASIKQLKPFVIEDEETNRQLERLLKNHRVALKELGPLPKEKTTLLQRSARCIHRQVQKAISHMKTNGVANILGLYLYELRPWDKDSLQYLKTIQVAIKSGEVMKLRLKQRKKLRPDFIEPEFKGKFVELKSTAKKYKSLLSCVKIVKRKNELDQAIHDELVGRVYPMLKLTEKLPKDSLGTFDLAIQFAEVYERLRLKPAASRERLLAMARRSSIARTLIGEQRMAQLYRTFDFVDGDYSVEVLAPEELVAEMQARCVKCEVNTEEEKGEHDVQPD
jgi:hypothetical protein